MFPFVEAGFTKADVREVSKHLGLRTWDKPAAACLASRVPYGTPVSLSVLTEVEAAETGLRELGFVELRVRHYGDLARIEVRHSTRLDEVVRRRTAVVERRPGCRLPLRPRSTSRGLRSGNLNQSLGQGG